MKVKMMVQGAIIAAIFGVLSLFNTYSASLLDSLIGYIMVVPLTWYGQTYSLKDNLILSFVSTIIVFMTGIPSFVIITMTSCLSGCVLGELVKRKASRSDMLIGLSLISLISNICIYEVFAGLLEIDMVEEMKEIYDMISSVTPYLVKVPVEEFIQYVPLLLIIMSAMEGYVILTLCDGFFMRLRIDFPKPVHISQLKLSKPLGLSITLLVVGSYLCFHYYMKHIILNYIYFLGMFILVIQGFSTLSYIGILYKHPILPLLLFYVALFTGYIKLFALLGVLDIFADIREKLYNKQIGG